MKKLLSSALLLVLMLGLPAISSAKGKKGKRHPIGGEVTAVSERTITIKEGKKGATKTIFVPAGVEIKGGGGKSSSSSASASSTNGKEAPTLSGLVGKHVQVKERSAGTASEITVTDGKGKKKKKKA